MKKLIIALSLISIISCSQIEKRGYAFDLSDYQLAKAGITSHEMLLELMGSPTLIHESENKELWIYFSEDVEKLLFFEPKILDRKIVTISFDKNGTIDKIGNYDLSDENKINFSSHYTAVSSNNKGFWSDLFGNIGKVRAN